MGIHKDKLLHMSDMDLCLMRHDCKKYGDNDFLKEIDEELSKRVKARNQNNPRKQKG